MAFYQRNCTHHWTRRRFLWSRKRVSRRCRLHTSFLRIHSSQSGNSCYCIAEHFTSCPTQLTPKGITHKFLSVEKRTSNCLKHNIKKQMQLIKISPLNQFKWKLLFEPLHLCCWPDLQFIYADLNVYFDAIWISDVEPSAMDPASKTNAFRFVFFSFQCTYWLTFVCPL